MFNWRGTRRTKMWEISKSFVVIGRVARCVTLLVQRMSVICQISKRETHDNQPRVRKTWWMRMLWCHFVSESKRVCAAMKCYKVDSRSFDISRSLTEKINVFETRILGLSSDERYFWKVSSSMFPIHAIASPYFLISNLQALKSSMTSSIYWTVDSILLRVIGDARHTKRSSEKRVR